MLNGINEARDIGLFRKILRGSFIIVAVVFSFTGNFAFNLDSSSYVTYNGPPNSFFGFAVTGYIDNSNKSLVLIGAPQDTDTLEGPNYKGGAVYICDADKPDNCQKAKFPGGQNLTGENRTQQWLGATLTSSGSKGIVVACAPRYWVKYNEYSDPTGLCYYTPTKGQLHFSESYNPCRVFSGKDSTYTGLGSGQAGFSAAIAKDSTRFYVGAVGSYSWKGVAFATDTKPPPTPSNSTREMPEFLDSYMGYSMTSLNFFEKGKSGIAVGIPRVLNVYGQVAIFTPTFERVKTLNGQEYADYFGYSMCASDVDGDGADDLIIGAPVHANENNYKDYEIGRIYVFYQGKIKCTKTDLKCGEKMFARNETIDGVDSGARFGSALASLGDINKDGYEDIAVSAPYQGSNQYDTCASAAPTTGAVYIYLGSKNGLSKTPSQVIKASDMAHLIKTSQLSAFGHSLSGGVDLDKNQYPDLVIGAYESDAAFLFKSRPVINLTASLSFLIKTTNRGKVIPLARNTCPSETKNENYVCVTLEICMQYNGVGVGNRIEISTNITLDTKYAKTSRMRFLKNANSILKSVFKLTENKKFCHNETVYVDNTDPNIDKVTPLEASLQYELAESKNKNALSSILNFGPTNRTDSFNISRNCGDDDICYPDLNFTIIPNIKQYDPFSNVDYLNLQVLVKNNGEDSYGSQFTLQVPKGLEYYSYENTPQTDKLANLINADGENITFGIGNPLPENQMVNFNVILRIDKAFQNLSSAFYFWAKVNSTDLKKNETLSDISFEIPIHQTVETVSLQINSESNGQTIDHSQYMTETVQKDIEAGPKAIHQYIIKNSGNVNLNEVSAIFFWPMKLTNVGDLLYLMEQPRTQGSIQCDNITNVNYRNLTKIRPYKNIIPWTNSSKPFSTNNPKPQRSTNQTISEDTFNNTVSFSGTDYQKVRCTIRNLSREEEVSVLFPFVVWMGTIKKIAGLGNKCIKIGAWVEVNVIKLSRNVTQISEKTYIRETITTIELIKSLQPDVIPLWIAVGSSVLGVLILMLMTYGLYKLGFFKRKRPDPQTPSAAENSNIDEFTSNNGQEREL
ncbi:integrin alpha-PS2-like [Planococcus citri]|uniref:integrin alpha-PS2-like n=1 Tax=Planococcus citri TaxID=170843 RepID=UPI0031F8A699